MVEQVVEHTDQREPVSQTESDVAELPVLEDMSLQTIPDKCMINIYRLSWRQTRSPYTRDEKTKPIVRT